MLLFVVLFVAGACHAEEVCRCEADSQLLGAALPKVVLELPGDTEASACTVSHCAQQLAQLGEAFNASSVQAVSFEAPVFSLDRNGLPTKDATFRLMPSRSSACAPDACCCPLQGDFSDTLLGTGFMLLTQNSSDILVDFLSDFLSGIGCGDGTVLAGSDSMRLRRSYWATESHLVLAYPDNEPQFVFYSLYQRGCSFETIKPDGLIKLIGILVGAAIVALAIVLIVIVCIKKKRRAYRAV